MVYNKACKVKKTKQERQDTKMTNELRSWGLSMYGGYYAEAWVGDENKGFHADKLAGLKAQLAEGGDNRSR